MGIEAIEPRDPDPARPLGTRWGYDRAEFDRLIELTDGCGRLILQDDAPIGMALGFPWGEVGWIGDVLVLEDHRGQGLGQAVTEAVIEALKEHGCTTIKLYATPKAISLYERLGFVGEAEYTIARGSHRRGRDPDVEPLADHLDAALALDGRVFGADRSALIDRLVKDHPETCLAVTDADGELAGFGIARPGDTLSEIGPVVVAGGNARPAQALVDGLLTRLPEGEVELTFPAGSWAASACWDCRGFVAVDTPLEMRLGPVVQEDRDAIVAAGGQELG